MALADFLKKNEAKLKIEDIEKFEKSYRVQLPESMKAIYLEQNGGYLFRCGNPDLDLPLKILYPINKSFRETGNTINKLLDEQRTDGLIPLNLVPFCSDEAGDNYYVRTDTSGYGKIYYIFSEFFDDFLENQEEYCVADSFDEFDAMIGKIGD